MVRLPGSTDPLTVAEDGMRNSDRPAGLVESPVLSNGHAGFGRRAEETDQSKDRHRALVRPHYESLYLQARGELRTQLKIALRQGRTCRVSRSRPAVARGKIRDMINIGERPVEAEDRAVPGFWEGDLIIGKGGKSQIATLVERASRFTMLVRIPYDRTAQRVSILLAQKMEHLPEFLRKSVTWDQGKEMADHASFTVKTGIDVYFCDPVRHEAPHCIPGRAGRNWRNVPRPDGLP